MNIAKKVLVLLFLTISLNLVGCTPAFRNYKPGANQKINPVGLYVILGSMSGGVDELYRAEMVESLESHVKGALASKGYSIKGLNDKVSQSKVYFSSLVWYFNEKKIAKIAKENGCETVLILFTILIVFLAGTNWISVKCSGWLLVLLIVKMGKY